MISQPSIEEAPSLARQAKAPKIDDANERASSAVVTHANSQRSIQSVELGFRLIRCLEEAESLSLKELSVRADMPASKAHLYLVSFRRVGLVSQEEGSGRYALGPYALQLGLAALRKLDVGRLAHPVLQNLSIETGEAVYLAVWGNRGPCVTVRFDGSRPLPMSLQIGYVLPVISTATGRIFLSYLSRKTTASIVEAESAESASRGRNYDEAVLEKIIAETRSRGVARTDGLLNIGFTALSAPVFAHDGALAAAITLIGPSDGIDASFTGAGAQKLRKAAEGLSVQMGLEARP
jgi:DNA-binding IclR family transcriptional regulator